MNAQTENFWPADIGTIITPTPASIMREQASFLAAKTRGLVEAQVKTITVEGSEIQHSFRLVAPALGGYLYELFRIGHPIFVYPVRVISDSSRDPASLPIRAPVKLSNEEEFKAWLKAILSADHTKKIITSLQSQSTESASK